MLVLKITKTLMLETHKDFNGLKVYHRYTPKQRYWKSFYLNQKEVETLFQLLCSFIPIDKLLKILENMIKNENKQN